MTSSCCFFSLSVSALVYQDAPYGVLSGVDWDKDPWRPEQQKETIDVVFGRAHTDSKEGLCWIMWCTPWQFSAMANVFITKGFTMPQVIYWHKPNYNTPGDRHSWLSTVEMCFVTFYSRRIDQRCSLSDNPWERHNHIVMPSVSTLSKIAVSSQVINPAEKPVQLAMRLIKPYVSAGESILVIGSGSGSEILAGLELKLNVFGVELDPVQWKAANERITFYSQHQQFQGGADPAFMDVDEQLQKDFVKPTHPEEDEGEGEAPEEHKKKTPKKRLVPAEPEVPASVSPSLLCVFCHQGATEETELTKCVHCDSKLHKLAPSGVQQGGESSCGVKCIDHGGAMACTEACVRVSHPMPAAPTVPEMQENPAASQENTQDPSPAAEGGL